MFVGYGKHVMNDPYAELVGISNQMSGEGIKCRKGN
jgi:hypothetical protein